MALISDKQFPLDIIKLLLKVTRWYGLKSTQMFYGDETVLFWIVIYQLYHAAGIIRFWSGDKTTGQYLTGVCARGDIDPQLSHINFAVPSLKNIRE